MLLGGAASGTVMVVRAGGASASLPAQLIYRLSKKRGQDEAAKQAV